MNLTSPTEGSLKEKRQKRKSNEKTPANKGGFKRTKGTRNQNIGSRSKKAKQMESALIAACNEALIIPHLKLKHHCLS